MKKLEIVLCVSHLYARNPTTEPIDAKKINKTNNKITKFINKLT